MDQAADQTPNFDQLVEEALRLQAAQETGRTTQRRDLAKISYTHQDCVDFIIANPGVSQNTLALRYGYSPSWVSIMINSDTFQARLAARRAELVDPTLTLTINERFNALTVRSLEVLQEKLCQDPTKVSDQLALQAAALGAKSLGLGQAPPPAAPSGDDLANLAERLISFTRRSRDGEVVDAAVREIPQKAA